VRRYNFPLYRNGVKLMLLEIGKQDNPCIKDIVRKSGVSYGYASHFIKWLEANGVIKTEKEGRLKFIFPSIDLIRMIKKINEVNELWENLT